MYDIHRALKAIQPEKVEDKNSRLLFGERARHDYGAEGVLIDSLHDNLLLSLYDKLKGDSSVYKENALSDLADEVDTDIDRYMESCNAIEDCATESTKLYAEAKKGINLKVILQKIVAFFKNLPSMIYRFFGKITLFFRKLKVKSSYLINRTEFFESFNDKAIALIRKELPDNKHMVKNMYGDWLEKHKSKLSNMKFSGNDEKDFKKALSYVVGYLPLRPRGLMGKELSHLQTRSLITVFGDSLVNAIMALASNAATIDDCDVYLDRTTINTANGLSKLLDMFPFMSLSSQTTYAALGEMKLAGVHGLFSVHHKYVSDLARELDENLILSLVDRTMSKNEKDNEYSIDQFIRATDKASVAVDKLKGYLTKVPTKRTKVDITNVLLYMNRLQESLYAILAGSANDIDEALRYNTYDSFNNLGKRAGTVASWGDIKTAIEQSKGQTIGYAFHIAEFKYAEMKSLLGVFEEYAKDYRPADFRKLRDIVKAAPTVDTGMIANAVQNYKTLCNAEELMTDFIAGYTENDNYVHQAINEYVRRANRLHGASINMAKIVNTLIELIYSINNYRVALLTDLAYRMAGVVDMFDLAQVILDGVKQNNDASESKREVIGHLAFNS